MVRRSIIEERVEKAKAEHAEKVIERGGWEASVVRRQQVEAARRSGVVSRRRGVAQVGRSRPKGSTAYLREGGQWKRIEGRDIGEEVQTLRKRGAEVKYLTEAEYATSQAPVSTPGGPSPFPMQPLYTQHLKQAAAGSYITREVDTRAAQARAHEQAFRLAARRQGVAYNPVPTFMVPKSPSEGAVVVAGQPTPPGTIHLSEKERLAQRYARYPLRVGGITYFG
ncbi:unnamed protein product, partial [marine sediment metagenome]